MSFSWFHGNFELAKIGHGRPTSEARRHVASRARAARQLASHARQLDPARLFGGPDAVAATPRPLAWPPSALTGEQPRLLCSIRVKDIVLKFEGKGFSTES